MTSWRRDRAPVWPLFAAAVVLPLAAVAAALVSQYRFNIQPCPWCVLQRVVFVIIATAALPGLLATAWQRQQRGAARVVQRISGGLIVLFCAAGAAAALWQHFVAAASKSCNLTLADTIVRGAGLDALWPAGFSAYASCAEAAIKLLGVPYEFYSLGLFTVLGALAWVAARRA